MRVLAGDVGGTKVALALFEAEGERLELLNERTLASARQESLAAAVRAFVDEHPGEIAAACFGLPGPVRSRRVELTNLPWEVDADQLAASLEIPQVSLMNDLEATARYVSRVPSDEQETLQEGEADPHGNAALIAAGTGLGEAGLFRDGDRLRPFASEGGHASFAPTTALDVELLRWLQDRHGSHVSWERVVSGPGLVSIYRFLREHRRVQEPDWLTQEMREGDAAAAISAAAMEGRFEPCAEALDLFVGHYAAEAANLALKVLATGGVWLGGGIAPKIVSRLRGRAFRDRFRAKGRMSELLERMPVRVIMEPRAALFGAARCAAAERTGS